jgi:hypothetical protein
MKSRTFIALFLLVAAGVIALFSSSVPPTAQAGFTSATLKNTTSSLVAGTITCGSTSSIALGPLNGINWLRLTNIATNTVFFGIVATTGPQFGSVASNTGIPLSGVGLSGPAGASTTNPGPTFFDIGQSNINIEGSYIACTSNTSGSQVAYQRAN